MNDSIEMNFAMRRTIPMRTQKSLSIAHEASPRQLRMRQPVRKIHQITARQSPVNAAMAIRLSPIGTSAMPKKDQRNPEIR